MRFRIDGSSSSEGNEYVSELNCIRFVYLKAQGNPPEVNRL